MRIRSPGIHRRTTLFSLVVLVCLTALAGPAAIAQAATLIMALAETDPIPSSGDSADDPAIWLHPTNNAQSTIIVTDKSGGLAVYDLAGTQIQYRADGKMNNVDLRYNFPLGGSKVALVGATNRSRGSIALYRVNTSTRMLEDVVGTRIYPGSSGYGTCMYRSPTSGKYYLFSISYGGSVEQWELFDNGSGKVNGKRVRSWSMGSTSEGCVADDANQALYIGQEAVGLWRYGAEPGAGTTRTKVDSTGSSGHLTADVEGVTLYSTSGGAGYLIVSSQGSSTFSVYDRTGSNAFRGTFSIAQGTVDAVTGTDGLDVTNVALNNQYSKGLLVVQDDVNDGANQNFKLVPWERVAAAFSPALQIDTSWDPRSAGAGTTPPAATATPAPTSAATATPIPTSAATATPVPQTTTTLSASADARVEQANSSSNYGSSSTLRVDGGGDPLVESYLRFSVPQLAGGIRSAKLRVYATTGSADGPAVYTSAASWSESSITWANRPGRSSSALGDKGGVSSSSWMEYDVTSAISGSGDYSFVLATSSNDGVNIDSRQGSKPPQLVIVSGG